MGTQQDDKTIVARLEQVIGQELGERVEYDEDGHLIALDLSKLGLTLLLSRFQGLSIKREVPCICHWETKAQKPCQEVYRYEEDLIRYMEAGWPTIQCRASRFDVSVLKLLFGIHTSTTPQVVASASD